MTYTSYQTMENQSSPSILLVEDDPALALIIKDTLEGEGFQVTHTPPTGCMVWMASCVVGLTSLWPTL